MSSVHQPITTKLDFMGSNLDPFQISARLFQNFGLDILFIMYKTLENKSKGKKQ